MCSMMFCKQMSLTYVMQALRRRQVNQQHQNGAKIIVWTAERNFVVVLENREYCWSSTAMETWVQNRTTNAINNCKHSWQIWDSWYRMRCSQGQIYSLWGTTWDKIFKRDRKCVYPISLAQLLLWCLTALMLPPPPFLWKRQWRLVPLWSDH